MKGRVSNLYMINGSLFIILGVICYLIVRGILIGTKKKTCDLVERNNKFFIRGLHLYGCCSNFIPFTNWFSF